MKTKRVRLSLALGALAALLGGSVWGVAHSGSSAATASFDWTESNYTTGSSSGAASADQITEPQAESASLNSFDWT